MGEQIYNQLKKYRFLTFALLFIVIAFFGTYGTMKATSTNEFCASCHSMAPQFYTFEASSHSNIDCVSCHIEPGFVNYMEAKLFGLKELYVTVTGTERPIIHSPYPISNEACSRCHNMNNREETTSGDLIMDHRIHEEEGVSCVTCHDGVAHGKVVERGAAYKTDWERWTADLGRYVMDTPLIKPQMKVCMDCHELREGPLECAACHTTGMYPDSHEQPDFMEYHGKLMEKNSGECIFCHSYMDPDPLEQFEDNTKTYELVFSGEKTSGFTVNYFEYAKKNQYCVDCHNERPPSHEKPAFFQLHGSNYNSEDANCLACHELRPIDNPKLENAVYCSTCHPSSHGDRWRTKHPIDVSDASTVEQSCLTCHVERKCLSCHTSPQEKRENVKEDNIDGREEEEYENGDGDGE